MHGCQVYDCQCFVHIQAAASKCYAELFCFKMLCRYRWQLYAEQLMWTSVYIHFLSFYTVVCNPPCENGACVANDTCSCSAGYEGVRCNETGMYIVAVHVILYASVLLSKWNIYCDYSCSVWGVWGEPLSEWRHVHNVCWWHHLPVSRRSKHCWLFLPDLHRSV